MRWIMTVGIVGLTACSSSPISQYCTKAASCATEDCDLSPEACEVERLGEKETCEAELKARADIIGVGSSNICQKCIESMDTFYRCAAEIETCTDFAEAREEDCDGEFTEYMRDCGPMIEAQCGGEGGDSGYDPYWTKGWTPTESGEEGGEGEASDESHDDHDDHDDHTYSTGYHDYDKYYDDETKYYDTRYYDYYGGTTTGWTDSYYDEYEDEYGGGSDCTDYGYGYEYYSYSCTDYGSGGTWRDEYGDSYTGKSFYYYYYEGYYSGS